MFCSLSQSFLYKVIFSSDDDLIHFLILSKSTNSKSHFGKHFHFQSNWLEGQNQEREMSGSPTELANTVLSVTITGAGMRQLWSVGSLATQVELPLTVGCSF